MWYAKQVCLAARVCLFLSLVYTHAFHLSSAKFLAWDMRRVVKQLTEQDEDRCSTLFAFEVQIFQLLRNFLTAKPIRHLS